MSFYLRQRIAASFLETVTKYLSKTDYTPEKLARLINVCPVTRKFDQSSPQLYMRGTILNRELETGNEDIQKAFCSSETVQFDKQNIMLKIDNKKYVSSIVNDILEDKDAYGHGIDLHRFIKTKRGIYHRPNSETVLVEFGSPNIAKPLHAGHLRSAIIGQFVAKINEVLGNRVIRMSYCGDWGTQFGLLAVGFRKFGNEEQLDKEGIEHLLNVYIRVNKLVEEEGTHGVTHQEALKFMQNLEKNDASALAIWSKFRNISLETQENIFHRLGVKFDHIEYESEYVEASLKLCESLHNSGFLTFTSENIGIVKDGKSKIILKKSDGTTLYLSRDLAAILNRQKHYAFDRTHYVVDAGQSPHFQKMRTVLKLLENDSADQENLHIAFGRVIGMSTRKGTAISLDAVLNESSARMLEIIRSKSTTKSLDLNFTAENLGLSAVFIQDLKEKRQKDYNFNWERMLSNKGATGVFLQYGHARLCSLETAFPNLLNTCDLSPLIEVEALKLAQHLSRFDEVLNESYSSLEPHHLVHYLLDLVTLSNVALSTLSVKNSPDNVAHARMRLFNATRLVISNGLKILGLTPLNEL